MRRRRPTMQHLYTVKDSHRLSAVLQLPSTTQKPLTASPPLRSIRIMKSSGNAKPLCYDVPLAQKVRLQQNVLSEFSITGQFESFGGEDFSQISIHYKTNHHLLISTNEINYTDGQETVKFSWEVMVKDYRLASAPVVGCWLVPYQTVTQRELSDFTVTQL